VDSWASILASTVPSPTSAATTASAGGCRRSRSAPNGWSTPKAYATSSVVECLDRPYAYVSSPTWTKALGVTRGAGKAEHIAVAGRLFPNYRAALTDGMADALLIAEYGRRLHTGRVAA
jgi:hypothetical protein